MTFLRGFVIIAVSAVVCAVVGGATGFFLGSYAPDFYRSMLPNGRGPDFDAAQIGLGLGLTQGLGCGVLVGCVIVLAVAWYNSRRHVVIMEAAPDEPVQPIETPAKRSEAIQSNR